MGTAARKLWRYVFPPVNVKFSVFSVILGYVAALFYGYSGEWLPWGSWVDPLIVLAVVAVTDFIAEGVWQHGWDILNDRGGGVSAFREEGPLAERIARGMVKWSLAAGVAATAFLLYTGRIAAVLVGWAAAYLAWRYSHERNECYPFLAVALAVAGGWFTATNKPGPELLTVAILGGMASRLSLAFYRYDDYAGINCRPDFPSPVDLMVYYRNLFWIILWFPWLATAMLLYKMTHWLIPFTMTLLVALELAHKRRHFCHKSNH